MSAYPAGLQHRSQWRGVNTNRSRAGRGYRFLDYPAPAASIEPPAEKIVPWFVQRRVEFEARQQPFRLTPLTVQQTVQQATRFIQQFNAKIPVGI